MHGRALTLILVVSAPDSVTIPSSNSGPQVATVVISSSNSGPHHPASSRANEAAMTGASKQPLGNPGMHAADRGVCMVGGAVWGVLC